MPHTLVLLRHGESEWNAENRFTGWADPDLSSAGEAEASAAGAALAAGGFEFDVVYTSVLRRAVRTTWLVLRALRCEWLPIVRDWRLNERSYGALTGLNKAETAAAHGEAQVKIWRRSYDVPPPALALGDARHPRHDRRYALYGVPAAALPAAESLADTVARVLPAWTGAIAPDIRAGKRVLVAAHGNSLRGLVMFLEGLTPAQILEREIPTGVPYVIQLDDDLRFVSARFLGDDAAVKAKQAAVAAQGRVAPPASEAAVAAAAAT